MLAGGLTARDTSASEIVAVSSGSTTRLGRLPAAQHDAPGASLAGGFYVFGGGDGVHQLDHILRIDPHSGAVSTVGRLPAASSDASAASIGSTAYVVGGYTGTRWLDTIVAVRPGGSARAVAHLPVGLRYAAVAASGTSLVIAGGSLADGSASRAVYRFDTRSSRVQRIASLPAGTTHAAAASLRGTVFVIGGRGATAGSVTAAIVAIDPGSGRIAGGGRLRTARSDLAAVTVGDQIVIAGGGTAHGVTAAVSALPQRQHRPSPLLSRRRRRPPTSTPPTGPVVSPAGARHPRAASTCPTSVEHRRRDRPAHVKVIAHYAWAGSRSTSRRPGTCARSR